MMNGQINQQDFHEMNASEFLAFSVKLLTARKEGRSITSIEAKGSKCPFFAVPGFLLYRQLSFYLGEDQPFYGFEPFENETVQDAARHYILEMKTIQPHGPYVFGAFCNHYPVIFEMADMLSKAGESVPLVVLIEAYHPSTNRSKISGSYIKWRLQLYKRQLKNSTMHSNLQFFMHEIKRCMELVYSRLVKRKQVVPSAKPYNGKVVIFNAETAINPWNDDPLTAWRDLVKGTIEVFTIPGRHIDILRHPHVLELAKKLEEVLDRQALLQGDRQSSIIRTRQL